MTDDSVLKESIFSRNIIAIILIAIIALAIGMVRLPGSQVILLFAFGLNAMVPLGLAAVGEVLNERGGLFNIGIEGTMLISAFVAVYFAEAFGGWIPGTIAAVAVGGFISLIFSIIATYGRGSQLIAGVGVNTFAGGLVAFYIWQIWVPGHHMLTSGYGIPDAVIAGQSFSYLIPITIGLGVLFYYVLNNTRFGLRVRSVGNNPFVADASAVDVYKYRIIACVIGGILTGLAGAYLSLGYQGMITNELTAGRGFIALACVVFSGLQPVLAVGAAGLFGFFQGFGRWMQNISWAKPMMRHGGNHIFQMIPYLVVLITLAIFVGKRRFPKSIGQPYQREK